jgi:hypothetical protein
LKLGLVDINGEHLIQSGEGCLIQLRMKPVSGWLNPPGLQIRRAILVDPNARKLDVEILNENSDSNLPSRFALSQNYPNPFNPQTVIQYALPFDCEVQVAIYNILGQRVRTLVNEHQEAGYRRVEWDSRNNEGVEVSSGVYFFRLQAGELTQSRKMLLLK